MSSNYVGPLGDTTFGGYSQIAAADAAWAGPRLVRDRRPETYHRQAATFAHPRPRPLQEAW